MIEDLIKMLVMILDLNVASNVLTNEQQIKLCGSTQILGRNTMKHNEYITIFSQLPCLLELEENRQRF